MTRKAEVKLKQFPNYTSDKSYITTTLITVTLQRGFMLHRTKQIDWQPLVTNACYRNGTFSGIFQRVTVGFLAMAITLISWIAFDPHYLHVKIIITIILE